MIMHWQGEKTASMETYYANSSALLEGSKKMLKRLLFRIKKYETWLTKNTACYYFRKETCITHQCLYFCSFENCSISLVADIK